MEKIDLVLYLLIGLIALHVFGALLRTYKGFYRDANKLYDLIQLTKDKGEFQVALEICDKHLLKRPEDSQLKWFKATILFKLDRKDEALDAFKRLCSTEPSWKESAEKYIQEIENQA